MWKNRLMLFLLPVLLNGCATLASPEKPSFCDTAEEITIGPEDKIGDLTSWQITREFCKRVKLCGDNDADGLCK